MKNVKLMIFSIFFVILLIGNSFVFAAIIHPEDREAGWRDPAAYRPCPILFLHGFGRGSYKSWIGEISSKYPGGEINVDGKLEGFFNKYYNPMVSVDSEKPYVFKDITRYPYLEIFSFIDFAQSARSQLIDRNSSVDTY